jgi:ribosomal protein S18 acetylase RimI-like enzyme
MIQLHQATKSDHNFCYLLKKATLKEHIAKIWDWDEEWQKDYHSKHFKPEVLKIITKSSENIGCISIIEEEDQFFLSLIEILPQFQNQGIGTTLIRELLKEAKEKQKDLYLQVLISNDKAQRLYKRMGFKVKEKTDTHIKMVFHS